MMNPTSLSVLNEQTAWEDSYVLSAFENGSDFCFVVLRALRVGRPRPGEAYEYLPTLVTGSAKSTAWLERNPTIHRDPDGTADFGYVISMSETPSDFRFKGECGEFLAQLNARCTYLDIGTRKLD